MGRKERAKFCSLKLKRFLYLISPNKIKINFYKDLEEVLSSNKVKYFQLRLKNISFFKYFKDWKKNKKNYKKIKLNFIINDFPDLVLKNKF